MKNYNADQALPVILKTAKEYDEKLKDKHFLIVYRRKDNICTCCVGFRDMNYLHLTGVKTSLPAQQFYSACLNGRLSVRDVKVDTGGGKISTETCCITIFARFAVSQLHGWRFHKQRNRHKR